MSEKLKPCPFCGGNAAVAQNTSVFLDYRVYCKRCGAETGMYTTAIKAVRCWNNREEQTCRMKRDTFGEWRCLACGETISSWSDSWAPNYCPNCGARVLSEEEQGHMVADAIRRLEKAVER